MRKKSTMFNSEWKVQKKWNFQFRANEYLAELIEMYAKKKNISMNEAVKDIIMSNKKIRKIDFQINCIWEDPLELDNS